ncbi:CHC2 zinc finger domain-containing protein [uncultured Microbulbifer sp.]|uniref:CHC2 zinc finger domain-containing protein n=1 Tax=uncultured Microbulbifer sp. TaxID=348147 RepID=UPI002616C401|nr:CHC2 zinc finger domain-containing protein [uncultured Microbulbifer sp.]
MARIADEVIERIKAEVSLERLVEQFGVELKKRGADLIGRCPFHDDKTPSLVVSPKSNLWHCLGACQTGGSVIDWVRSASATRWKSSVTTFPP